MQAYAAERMTAIAPIALSVAAEQRLQLVCAPEERREARRMLENECGRAIAFFCGDPIGCL